MAQFFTLCSTQTRVAEVNFLPWKLPPESICTLNELISVDRGNFYLVRSKKFNIFNKINVFVFEPISSEQMIWQCRNQFWILVPRDGALVSGAVVSSPSSMDSLFTTSIMPSILQASFCPNESLRSSFSSVPPLNSESWTWSIICRLAELPSEVASTASIATSKAASVVLSLSKHSFTFQSVPGT